MTNETAMRFMPSAMVALAMVLGGTAAKAQGYPTRPVQVIVPFAGGSASDVVTRIMLERAGKSIGHTFIIDNRPGAGSMPERWPPPRPRPTVTPWSGAAPDRSPPTRRSTAISATTPRRTSSRSR